MASSLTASAVKRLIETLGSRHRAGELSLADCRFIIDCLDLMPTLRAWVEIWKKEEGDQNNE